ncbi:protease modulator HflC [Uliginosibacterium paludis]|uniref:Protein HflC n=1 Tax=Uliginosibacterium paludis TaxID=1615952 RepID=A0ABV2CRB3_9RHOO
MNARLPVILGALLLAAALLSMSVFTLDQRNYALVFQLGEIKRFEVEPGLKFKLPLVQDVKFFDRRILTLDTTESELFQTAEKKNVLVDSFVKWRIKDPSVFYRAFGVEETRARLRLEQTINAVLREEFGKRQVHDVISGERHKLMAVVKGKAAAESIQYGVEIVDVRVKRVELPNDVSESVYRRMEAERKRVANELRSTGAAEAEQIKADADRRREVVVAEAYRDAQILKGEGDAKAAAVYAEAFGRSPEFYRFWRSMDAYKQSFRNKNDMLVVDPSSDFFKYMKSGGKDSGK